MLFKNSRISWSTYHENKHHDLLLRTWTEYNLHRTVTVHYLACDRGHNIVFNSCKSQASIDPTEQFRDGTDESQDDKKKPNTHSSLPHRWISLLQVLVLRLMLYISYILTSEIRGVCESYGCEIICRGLIQGYRGTAGENHRANSPYGSLLSHFLYSWVPCVCVLSRVPSTCSSNRADLE